MDKRHGIYEKQTSPNFKLLNNSQAPDFKIFEDELPKVLKILKALLRAAIQFELQASNQPNDALINKSLLQHFKNCLTTIQEQQAQGHFHKKLNQFEK
jgi:hypothetical protein